MKSAQTNPPEKICRLCLSASGVILPIFDGEVAERFSVPLPHKILSCLSIKVCVDDPLPPHICHRCLYEVDRFYEFRETCKRTNSTFNKICNNSSESVPFDVNQVLEIKQELHDESVYHDAISDLLSDDDGSDVNSSRSRKRMRCRSLLESMKRVQQTQPATVPAEVLTTPTASAEHLPSQWMEQTKETSNPNSTSAEMQPQFECRYCSKPFMYQTSLLQHEELHAKGVAGDGDIEHIDHPSEPLAPNHDHTLQSSGQVVHQPQEETHNPAPEPEPSTGPLPPPPQSSTDGSAAAVAVAAAAAVENVTLTDVTAMLLEGAFEGVRPLSAHPTNSCRFCHDEFNNPDLLRRHERLYCNRKPSLLKHKHHMHHLHQPSHQPGLETHHPNEHVLQQHSNAHLQQHSEHSHHMVIQHQNDVPSQQEQQMILSQKGTKDSNFTNASKACKHCNKDFIHRGSLWRHQMFCDANPDKDVNRAVAGTKKKTFMTKVIDGGMPSISNQAHSTVAFGSQHSSGQIRRGGGPTTSGPFKCKFCEKRFLHRGSWWRHQKMFCADNPDTPTVKAAAAAAKERNQQEALGFACRYCDRTFVHRGSCWHHEQTHSGVREHACRYCSKTFNEKSRVARHERMHLGIKPFTCNQCGKAFCDASNLRNHEQIHGERACFLCAWCGKSYTRRPLLLKHEQVHAGEGQVFTCSSCPRTFPNTETLNAHMLTHTQEKNKKLYLCQACGQTFRSQSMLSQHSQNIHGNMSVPEQQQQHSQSEIQSHVQQHLHQQPQIKQHETASQDQQQQHQQIQDQDSQHHLTCSVCSKVFTDFSSLRHHQLLHSGAPRQYRCSDTTCNATFLQRNQLEAHTLLHEKSHSTLPTSAPPSGSVFHQQEQSLLQSHEMQHLQHHELLHRSGTYVLESEALSGQALTVHHLVGHLPQ